MAFNGSHSLFNYILFTLSLLIRRLARSTSRKQANLQAASADSAPIGNFEVVILALF